MSRAEALVQQGEAALADEEFALALRLLHEAERAGAEPDRCSGNRWLAEMLCGNFEAAWQESDAIRGRGAPDPHRFWQGEELRGKRVILRSLHGFGDAVQMFRFLPRLQRMAAHLIVEVPPRLRELAPCFDGMGEVITWGKDAPVRPPDWEVQAEAMELPYLLRVRAPEDLRPTSGYLRLPEAVRAEATTVLGRRSRPRVGVVWTAGHWNPARSVPGELVAGLTKIGGLEFWSLEARATAAPPGGPWRDVYEVGDGILRLAAVVELMDLVITVDTLAAHLAGALGRPCWVLLQHRADWRWMSGRADSPWYPSLRLLRQPAPGDWAGLLGQVRRALQVWAAEPAQS